MKIKSIRLAGIDLDNERFRTSYFSNLDGLIQSIRKVGLLSPPRLRAGKKGWVIVAGWKRILAAAELRLSSIPAIEASEGNDLDCFLASFEENLATREMGLLEKSIALARLEEFGVEKKRLIRGFLPRLGLPATGAHLHLFLALARADDETKRFVAEKNPPPVVVEKFLQLKPGERALILPLLRPLGQNKQKELLDDLIAVGLRDNKPIHQLLAEIEIETGAGGEKFSTLEKAELVRNELQRRRYPRLFRARTAFAAARKRLSLSEAIRIEATPFFEDPGLTVSFRCRTKEEFKLCLAELEKVVDQEALAFLFRIGRES
ncbi:MAG: ParB/RepB/Spo0J family partition protein [Candidatus Aminicenantales bacterium]